MAATSKSELINKWRTCHEFRKNALYGFISGLMGCVIFWNLRCHKLVRDLNKEYNFLTPEQLNTTAWGINIGFKLLGLGLLLKSAKKYKECK